MEQKIVSTNRFSDELLGEVVCVSVDEVPAIMQRARQAQPGWAARPLKERLYFVRQLQRAVYRHYDELVEIMVAEQGKSVQDATAELLPTLEMFSFYHRNARHILKPRHVFVFLAGHRRHRVVRRPHGVVLVISPWNFPVLLPMTSVVAGLVAGNAVILKPSEYSTQVSELLGQAIRESGIPPGVFQMVQGYGDVGAALIEAGPNKICFTGGESTGRIIGTEGGRRLIPTTLELGGKDAAIVLEDANIPRTARGIVWAGTLNAGQACVSIERVYVLRPVADQLVAEIEQVIDRYVQPGPGHDPRSTYGSISTDAQLQVIERQIEEAKRSTPQIIIGKKAPLQPRFVRPTVLVDVPEDLTVIQEETFGPVLTVTVVDSEEEAIERANASRYGLSASIWTENNQRALRLADQLEVGVVSINDHIWSSSAPHMPWGGVKASGYGRTRGIEGLLDMTVAQAISYERFRLPIEPFWLPYTRFKRELLRRFVDLWYGPTWRDKLRAFSFPYRRKVG